MAHTRGLPMCLFLCFDVARTWFGLACPRCRRIWVGGASLPHGKGGSSLGMCARCTMLPLSLSLAYCRCLIIDSLFFKCNITAFGFHPCAPRLRQVVFPWTVMRSSSERLRCCLGAR